MPFTFAHPAAVLPLRRRFKSLKTVPLIVGSVAPDLPYFVPMRFNRLMLDTHTFSGVIWLDLPIGMAVLLFGFVFRRPLTALLSPRARALCLQSVQHFRDQPMHWIWAPFAIIVGAWTHILWDSFTHDNGWVVKRVAALSAPITLGGWYTGTVCHVLQYMSSIAGLLILWIWFRRLPTPPLESPAPGTLSSSTRTAIFVLVCAAGAAMGAYKAISIMLGGSTYYRVIYILLTRATAWFALLYFIAGVFVTLSRSRSRKPEPVAEEI